MPELVEWNLTDDGDRGGVKELGGLRAGKGRADDHAPVLVDDDPSGAGRVASVEARACRPRGVDVDGADVQAVLLRRGKGEPGGGHLVVRKGHPRRAFAIGRRSDVLAENVTGSDPRLVLTHVGEERSPVHITDGIEPVRPAEPELVIDLETALDLDPDALEPNALGACR